MAERTMKRFRAELSKILDAAYLVYDKTMMYGAEKEQNEATARLDTIKEIAELVGLLKTERKRCFYGPCGIFLKRGSVSKYCSNACKQKLYRVKNGQIKK